MKNIGVITHKLEYFREFLRERAVEGKFEGKNFVSSNENYFPILTEQDIRGRIFDEVIELRSGYMNEDYDRISQFIRLKEFTCMKECLYVEPCQKNEICLNCGSSIIPLPRKGYFAICGRGYLGLITHNFKREVTYADGNHDYTYTGVHICEDKKFFGTRWSSRNPKIIGKLNFLTLPNII